MQTLLDAFCAVLTAERDVHRELLRLSEAKKVAITENNLSDLDGIVKQEQILLTRLNEEERKRRDCVNALAARLGQRAADIVLQDFLNVSDVRHAEQLNALYTELTDLLDRQVRLNEINRKLIESRLEYIHYTLDAVSQRQSPSRLYGVDGADAPAPARKNNIIDQKV
ncbi:MAG: flagellar protein FlgN [Oscillospiraceae bacterium]|jgi:flagellar biosynthesis/type III secretory pathway chaperone|nr:flagellar protein FlgN [Oscillospiraceae bacterium]